MGYASRLLTDGEELRAELRSHPVRLLAPGLLLVLAVAGAVTIGIELPQAPVEVAWLLEAMVALPALWLVVRIVRWRAVCLLVTANRLVYRRGVLRRDIVQLRLQRVAEVHCTQSLLDRLIGCGRLVLEVVGDDPLVIEDVRRPRSVQRLIGGCLDDLAAYRPYPVAEGYPIAGGYPASRAYPVTESYQPTGAHPVTESYQPTGAHPVAEAYQASGAYPAHDAYPLAGALPPAPRAFEPSFAHTDTPPHGIAANEPLSMAVGRDRASGFPGAAPADRDRTDWMLDWGRDGRPAQVATPPGDSIPARLIQLDELHRRGIISPQEFAAKKAELLSRL